MIGFVAALFSKERKMYKAVKNILGFYPGNIFLYRLAFRHKSASYVVGGLKSNNERLEYLGDSVISTAVAHYLFKRYPNQDEGFLTEMRSKMVSRATLNKVAAKMGLHEMLNIDTKSGSFKSVDGNALEALMGAVFLDKGYRFTERIIVRRLIGIHIDMDEIEKRDWNYKSKLIDWGQKERCRIHFQVMGTMNQKGKKLYKVAAMVNEAVWGEGVDQSIKAAEQIASENAYKNRVIPAMERNSKKGYRDPLPDAAPVIAADPVSDAGLCTITASLDFMVPKESLERMATQPEPEGMKPQDGTIEIEPEVLEKTTVAENTQPQMEEIETKPETEGEKDSIPVEIIVVEKDTTKPTSKKKRATASAVKSNAKTVAKSGTKTTTQRKSRTTEGKEG